jgi:integrase
MASIRKRAWTSRGARRSAWIVDYIDRGRRHIQTFATRREADAAMTAIRHQVREGTHSAASTSRTVAEAAQDWLTAVELRERERATLKGYREHVELHINPALGNIKLSALTAPPDRCLLRSPTATQIAAFGT